MSRSGLNSTWAIMNNSRASVPLMFFDFPGDAPFKDGCTPIVLQITFVASSESSIYSPPLMNDSNDDIVLLVFIDLIIPEMGYEALAGVLLSGKEVVQLL